MDNLLNYCARKLEEAGLDKYQCVLNESRLQEMNLEGSDFTLIRSIFDHNLGITAIKDQRRGSISINRLERETIDQAVQTVEELLQTSEQDPDYDIAPLQPSQKFVAGAQEADTECMYELLKEYSQQVPALFPAILLLESTFSFTHAQTRFINSNGVDFTTKEGVYNFSSVFSAKEGDKTTSFNHTGFSLQDLASPLLGQASLQDLLTQAVEHLQARPLGDKFEGDIIITPDCLHSFIEYYAFTYLGDRALITATSPFKNLLDQKVAHAKLTVSAEPLSPHMAQGYFITGDGYAVENATFIDKGVLKSFLLSQYGAKKTKLDRALNSGGCWVVAPGDQSLDDLIKDVKKGILMARFSGGGPSPNGDFSGVAKNSYYIEDGEIRYPLSETMVAGNLGDLFSNIRGISQERINFGMAILPYISAGTVTISGQ